MRVRELAEWLGAGFEGDGELELTGVAPLETAGPGDLSFVSNPKAAREAAASAAGCLLAPLDLPAWDSRALIRVQATRNAFARAITRFHPPLAPAPGIHPSAAIALDAHIGAGVSIGPHVSIAAGARIGEGSSIGPGCAIGRGVTLGERCVLHARVTIYDGVRIGNGCILHSGCVIGADGFGFVFDAGRWEKFPQVGIVELGDNVEVGANACIDRAALGVTSIGEGSKLDNMVHVG
ncbi:MAG: UDP-3-O-(3-hydroxymyristoyl)glucosamine N-acyltransferase, partial [Bryobacteraceae bacterium]